MAPKPDQAQYVYSTLRHKCIQLSSLHPDGFLLLDEDPDKWIRGNPGDLLSVRILELILDWRVEKIGDSIGQLSHLTHLFIVNGNYKCLPNSIAGLPYLQRLELLHCNQLQELPADLGDSNRLTFLSLTNSGVSKLSKLTSLHLIYCESLKELPAYSNVVELKLHDCHSIQTLPEGLCNLKHLRLYDCTSLTELPTDLNVLELLKIYRCCSIHSFPKGLTNLKHLHLPLCAKEWLMNLMHLPSLCHLTFHTSCSCRARLEELAANLGKLSELLTLNISGNIIKWLPWSITKLSKLRHLSLPEYFRLETLPRHLNGSIIISVENTHIRKTWKQLKTEIHLCSIPVVGEETIHSPSTKGYLRKEADLGLWTPKNSLHSLARILDLELRDHDVDRSIINFICDLPELTHLYISNGYLYYLPLTRLTHLSLFKCDFNSCYDSLGKLSTLHSLTLLNCRNLPKHLDLPDSLTHFALDSHYSYRILPDSYMSSMRKLLNLKTLNLSQFKDLELSQLDLNLFRLKIINCTIKSLPRGMHHLEIIHSKLLHDNEDDDTCFDELQECLKQPIYMRTLSITCSNIKVLPSIGRHKTLQEVQLKGCFNLRKLPPNLNDLVELCSLNVSGTRIKSLPDSIIKLQNLGHLTLPKCFIRKSLPKKFEDKIRVFDDDTDDVYYQDAGYYDSDYDFSENYEIVSECTEGGNEVASKELSHDCVIEQVSTNSLPSSLPDATQVQGGSHLSSRTVPLDNGFSSSQNLEMEVFLNVNEDYVVPLPPNNFSNCKEIDRHKFSSSIWPAHADPTELEGSFYGGIDAVDESTSDAHCNLQNQEMETLTLKDRGCAIHVAEGLAAISSSNIHENQQGFHNGEMDIIHSENEQRSHPCDLIYSVRGERDDNALEDGQDNSPQSVDVKHNKKTHKIAVSKESIRKCMSQNMRLEDAAKHLNLKRSTMKRRLKEYGLTWTRNRRRKQHENAKIKEHNMKSPSERNCSQLSLVEPSNLAGQDHRVEHIDGSCSTFDVKATYKGDIVRIYRFSLSSGIEQLKEEVGEKLGLEVGRFKMKFLDEDNDLILMSSVSDLEHALHISKSSGSNVAKLSVILSET